MPSVQDFITLIRNRGLARTEKFAVEITSPNIMGASSPTVSMLCDEASFPGVNIQTKALRIHNLNIQRPLTIDYEGETASFVFFVDSTWETKRYFDKWVDFIIDRTRQINQYRDIVGSVIVKAIHEGSINTVTNGRVPYAENVRYAIRLVNAYPRSITALPTSNSAVGVHRLGVSFTYKYWEPIEVTPTLPDISETAQPELTIPRQAITITG